MNSPPFESYNFHDNFIHGISFADENYESDLSFDIDHIIRWYCENEPCEFLVAPAILKFRKVSSVNISIIKECRTLNFYLGIIEDITSVKIKDQSKKYEIKLVGQDKISFCAESAEVQIKGSGIRVNSQYLTVEQRSRA